MSTAEELLSTVRAELSGAGSPVPVPPGVAGTGRERLLSAFAEGRAPLRAVAALAAEEWHIVASDRSSFLMLAARSSGPLAADFFAGLADGERAALGTVPALAAAAGLDRAALAGYEPTAGCQAYPAYLSWLAFHAEPADVVLAVTVNFADWGAACATLARALRERYGLTDEALAFLDFFATPSADLERQALAAVQEALDAGLPLSGARRYARLLRDYELLFWGTLADLLPPGS